MAHVAAGELTSSQLAELDRVIRSAEQASRFEFSVYVGPAGDDPTLHARQLHASLAAPSHSILVLVDPAARVLEVVTGSEVRRHLTDPEVELAVLAMQSEFADGGLVAGLKRGLALLAEHARPQTSLHVKG